MPAEDRSDRYCVIGAGSSGLAALKNLLQAGLAADCLEREDDVGGNWYYGRPHSSVYQSVHLISSKRLTEYTDFPMPAEYPQYPHHALVWDYLRAYARRFGLYERIEFNVGVARCLPEGSGWRVILEGGRERLYRGLVVANGHNWDPRRPQYPGSFHGLSLHSSEYKTPDALRGRRVLVVGAGNSGCDIAVEAAQHAAAAYHSLRRGYHFLPKFIHGKPVDQTGELLHRLRLPRRIRQWIARTAAHWAIGRPEQFGLPKPDHRLFQTHPIVNSQLLYCAGHGDLCIKPDVAELCGDAVRFVDGTSVPVDVIIYATGFKISFPFLDREHLAYVDERPGLYLNVFHPQRDDLFVIGLIQPDSGQFGLVDCQSQLMSRFLRAYEKHEPSAAWFRRLKAGPQPDLSGGIGYLNSSRHLLEVEHFSYRRRLEGLIRKFGPGR